MALPVLSSGHTLCRWRSRANRGERKNPMEVNSFSARKTATCFSVIESPTAKCVCEMSGTGLVFTSLANLWCLLKFSLKIAKRDKRPLYVLTVAIKKGLNNKHLSKGLVSSHDWGYHFICRALLLTELTEILIVQNGVQTEWQKIMYHICVWESVCACAQCWDENKYQACTYLPAIIAKFEK